jgi:hypothetical protein
MNKIKDRVTLSILAGGVGTVAMMAIDMISAKLKISQRSYPTTAAGVWVSSRKQAEGWQGQTLGTIMTLGLSMVGAFGLINLLSKYGRDKIITKGLFFGTSFGSIINAMLSGLTSKKIKPKDAASNLSYIISSAVFGTITALVASKMGHDSIYDAPPRNNWVNPTEKTTEELRPKTPNNIDKESIQLGLH